MTSAAKERPIDFRIFKDLNVPEVSIPAGQVVIAEDCEDMLMYIIRRGTVEVRVNNILVEEIGEGGIFGEMALIERAGRTARIIAKTDVTAMPLDEKSFTSLIVKVPHFALLVMRCMARRLRKMNAKFVAAA